MKVIMRALLAPAIIIALIILTACSREFIVRPSGQFDQRVTFEFYRTARATEPAKFNIVEFVVQEKKNGPHWQTVWELKGKQSLSEITYANKYEGLEEIVSARPLSREAKYRVIASELNRTGPKGYSAVYFAFGANGVVITADPE